jgi:hypothetical protein
VVLGGIFSSLIAQDFQTVNSGRIPWFVDAVGNVNCIRIDSVESQPDSVFYPFATIQQIGNDCVTPDLGSWAGRKIIHRKDGDDIFINNNSDSIFLKTNASLDQSWNAFNLPNSARVIATVSRLDTLSFLGLIDSAKTIGFKVYDKTGNILDHKLNNMSVILSKNFGIVRTFNFALFPEFEPNFYYGEGLQEYNLGGISNANAGIGNLTWFEVHDFQSGDEFHINYESSNWDLPGRGNAESRKTILRYLERTDFPDSIVYRAERIQSSKNTVDTNTRFEFIHDTIRSVIKPKPEFDKLPGEILHSEYDISNLTMNYDGWLSKTEPSVYTSYHQAFDSCWSNCCSDGCFWADTYIKGLGGPYYSCTNAFSMGGTENKLVYYKKGNETWGTPLVITAIEEDCTTENIEIYPNPVKDVVFITVQNPDLPLVFELINIEGSIVSTVEISSVSFAFNIEKYKSGMYLYRISKNDGVIVSGRLVIE